MEKKELIGTAEAARILGISRVAVFKKIRKGEIEAVKVGRNYVIDRRSLGEVFQETTPRAKKRIEDAVDRAVGQYGEALRRLGRE